MKSAGPAMAASALAGAPAGVRPGQLFLDRVEHIAAAWAPAGWPPGSLPGSPPGGPPSGTLIHGSREEACLSHGHGDEAAQKNFNRPGLRPSA